MHMLSIVQMLYLSSKSLSVHRHRDKDEGDDGGKTRLTAQRSLPIEIAMSDGHLISKH